MAIKKFVFFDSETGEFKEQVASTDTIKVPTANASDEAVNLGQVQSLLSADYTTLSGMVAAEASARADSISSAISAEVQDRNNAISSAVQAETNARESADTALDSRLDTLEADDSNASSVRGLIKAAQTLLSGDVGGLNGRLTTLEGVTYSSGVQKTGATVSLKIGDADHLEIDNTDGLKLKGALVNGGNADAEHRHERIVIAMTNNSAGKFVKSDSSEAMPAQSSDCIGYALDTNKVVVSGLVELTAQDPMMSSLSTSHPQDGHLYLMINGTFGSYANVVGNTWAIPVGKKISDTKFLVQIGAPVFKA